MVKREQGEEGNAHALEGEGYKRRMKYNCATRSSSIVVCSYDIQVPRYLPRTVLNRVSRNLGLKPSY